MSMKTLALCLPLTCLMSCQALKDIAPGSRSSEADPAEAAAKTEKAARLTPEHEKLAALAGTWDVTFKHRVGPNSDWMEDKGTAKARLGLDGRYLVEELDCTYAGQPYKGFRIHGYDNLEKVYFNIWMDTLGTWPVTSRGTADDEGVVRYIGRWKDTATPAGRPFRTVARRDGDDKWKLELWDTIDGEEVQILEAIYTRRK